MYCVVNSDIVVLTFIYVPDPFTKLPYSSDYTTVSVRGDNMNTFIAILCLGFGKVLFIYKKLLVIYILNTLVQAESFYL